MTEETTALAIPAKNDLQAMFAREDGLDPIIAQIEVEVRSHAADTSTKKGRDAIKSLAYKVSRSKTALDEAGKALNEEARAQITAVDAARKKARDRLDALRAEARKPLDDWEAAEAKREATVNSALDQIRNHGMSTDDGTAAIQAKATEIGAIEITPEFGDYFGIANAAKDAAMTALRDLYRAAKAREEAEAELAALRAEKEAREAAEAAQRAEAEAKAAEEQRRRDQAAREKAEADRLEAARKEAAEKAQAEAEARHRREIEEAKAREAAAAQRERDRIEAEQAAARREQEKRDANAKIRAAGIKAIVDAIRDMTPEQIAEALAAGNVPHCKVQF